MSETPVDASKIVIQYDPVKMATNIISNKGTLTIPDEMLVKKKSVCKAIDALVDRSVGGPAGTCEIEASSATHAMVAKVAELAAGKAKRNG